MILILVTEIKLFMAKSKNDTHGFRLMITAALTQQGAIAGGGHSLHDNGDENSYELAPFTKSYLKTLSPDLARTLWAEQSRVDEWMDDKFGVFMHWDPSCQITSQTSWSSAGPRPHHSSDKKPRSKNAIPQDVYDNLYKTFNPTKFDAEEWVKMILDAGARYLVITAKHHQGFTMYDSDVTDYDIMSTPFKRDVMKELTAACQKYGVKFFFYYSQPDWTEELYKLDPASPEFEKFRKDFLYPQVKELVTKFGRIDGIWWDGLGKHPDIWDTPGLLKMMREIQPHILSNHRCAPRHWRLGDFDGPEWSIGRFQINRPWETCTVIGGGWGYAGAAGGMSIADCINLLVRCAGNGGNLLLNTGPTEEGLINPRHAERYRMMGAWLRQYGKSIYGTRGGPYKPGPWGCATRSRTENKIYLHILANWNGFLELPDIGAKVISHDVLTGGDAKIEQREGKLFIEIEKNRKGNRLEVLHEFNTVIELEIDKNPMELGVVDSVKSSLTIGAKVKASTELNEQSKSEFIVATDANEFSEGTLIKSSWRPSRDDHQPWVEIDFNGIKAISQIQLQEGHRYGMPSNVRLFTISLKRNGKWQEVFVGNEIGNAFAVVLEKTIEAEAMRIDLKHLKGIFTLNTVNVY
jgi:alpha-L-fucosidase